MSTTELDAGTDTLTWHTVSQVVFPDEANDDALAIYLDFGRQIGGHPDSGAEEKSESTTNHHRAIDFEGSDVVLGRRSLMVTPGRRVSLGTYYNAFPASYWRKWTYVDTVRLSVTVSGHVDVVVNRSTARGTINRVDGAANHAGTTTFTFDLSLANFGDGGWYWFDLVGHDGAARLESAEWQVAEEPVRPGTLSIGITTLNRSDFCKAVVADVAAATRLREVLDTLYVVDQGTKVVEDEPGWADVAAEMGSQLRVIHQANLGGSGGFARGMRESVRAGKSQFHMMLDDDVKIEPESILRALTFATYCRRPTLVGAHMFDIYNRSMLHNFGEAVDPWKWFWGPVRGLEYAHNIAEQNMRATPWMHRRIDVDYNGWWMTLCPVEVIREIGTSLPLFIKWDDAEFGIRAKEHGFSTVTLPGACVWHVSWSEKDDTVDWQAYYHMRNRLVAALLHSPYSRGGSLLSDSVVGAAKQGLMMQYYALHLRNMALRDVLSGPSHLHPTLATKLPELRALTSEFPDAQFDSNPDAYPLPKTAKPPKRGKHPTQPRLRHLPLWAATTGLKQWRAPHQGSAETPEVALAHADSKWWALSKYDSALVTKADGSGVAFYRREPERLRSLAAENLRLHAELRRRWDQLAQEYRAALPELTSLETWEATFGITRSGDE